MTNSFTHNASASVETSSSAAPTVSTTESPVSTPQGIPMRDCVEQALRNYFQTCGKPAPELWELVFSEVADPLLKLSLEYCRGNQSKAAIMLGISRGTLRKNLKKYGLID
ncbi:MAG: helix-turn-helix domain-containing protein [Gammaproteobacteria bacterium]